MSRVIGHTETARAFRELARYVAAPGNRAAKRALEPTLVLAKNLAPVDTGTLRRSLIIRRDRQSPKTRPRYVVYANPKTRGPDGRRPARYLHLVEFGFLSHVGAGFLTSAYEATKDQAVRIFGQIFGPELEKQAARVNRQKAKAAFRRFGRAVGF